MAVPVRNMTWVSNREYSQVRMVDTISQPGCAECGARGLVLTDYRPYAFLRALFGSYHHADLIDPSGVGRETVGGGEASTSETRVVGKETGT